MTASQSLVVTVIAIQVEGTAYADFNGNSYFVGYRPDIGHAFHGVLADDDDEIAALARSLGCRALYYDVPLFEAIAFVQNYGTGEDPVTLLSKRRQRFETDPVTERSRLVTYTID